MYLCGGCLHTPPPLLPLSLSLSLSPGFPVAHDLWPGLLCSGDDACSCRQIRHGPVWSRVQSKSSEQGGQGSMREGGRRRRNEQ